MRTNRTCINAIKKQNLWLVTEAIAEAKSRHHGHLIPGWQFYLEDPSRISVDCPSDGERQCMYDYLFEIPPDQIPTDPWEK